MEFRILGPLEVGEDGRALDLGGAKQRALLALLVLRRGEVVSIDQLIDGVWGERAPAAAAKSVHVYVSALRKALGERTIETRGHGYVLRVAPGAVDLERFDRLLAEGRASLAAGEPLAQRVIARERL